MPALPVWIKNVFISCIVIGFDMQKLLGSLGYFAEELRFLDVSVRTHAYIQKSEDHLRKFPMK
jgi:hypothetical protein